MYRPQSLGISNKGGDRYVYAVPVVIGDSRRSMIRELPNVHGINVGNDLRSHVLYRHEGNKGLNHDRYRCLTDKVNDMDHQISNLIRENVPTSGLSQSQSFSGCPPIVAFSTSYNVRLPTTHTSRLSACTYMSPPSPHWTTVGNVMTVKRSTSMPGARPNSVSLPPLRNHETHASTKKRFGPLQCLRHQLRRVGYKDHADGDKHDSVVVSLPSRSPKNSKSLFKKKPSVAVNSGCDASTKSRGIKKSISLLFSKSNRSSKSDTSIVDQKETPTNQHRNGSDSKTPFSRASRRNRSYESMLTSGEAMLSTDATKSCSYSDVQDTVSMSITKPSMSVDVMYSRTASESSLSESVSVCSSEQLLGSQTASCYGNIGYRNNDNGWKTVVGNVCRSNSKDSAIANSTLSGDGMIGQSKRISLTSTISRTSDLTTASEDFHDSSYSSFNDLQTNCQQYYYSKPWLLSAVSHLKPLDIEHTVVEVTDTSDVSPASNSSTETLRPLCCRHRRRYRSASNHSSLPMHPSSDRKSLRRAHSWSSGCSRVPPTVFTPVLASKPPLPPLPPKSAVITPKTAFFYPKLKVAHLQHGHVNSSPLLSQYSRLYSLRSSVDRHSLSGSALAPTSPIKYAISRPFHP